MRRAIATGEFLHASCGVDEFLLAGEERMARRADTNLNILLCGARLVDRTACTVDHRVGVIRVNICFHNKKGTVTIGVPDDHRK